MRRSGITGIINTKNEASNIEMAIRSLSELVDEVLVADMGSTDDTVAIAASMGARVIGVEDFSYVEPARKFAASFAQYEWLFFLDADEIVPATLRKSLLEIVREDEFDVIIISRMNFMFGDRIRGGGWGIENDRVVRFFRHGCVALPEVIHMTPAAVEGARVLELGAQDNLCIVHFNYLSWDHFVEKMNRYTDVEAQTLVARGDRPMSVRAIAWHLLRRVVWRRYVRQKGYRDGVSGLGLVWMMMTYSVLTQMKHRYILRFGGKIEVEAEYMRIARGLWDSSDVDGREA